MTTPSPKFNAYLHVPITQPLHHHPYDPSIVVIDPDIDILEIALPENRPEATIVALLGTNKGKVQTLIRVPQNVFDDRELLLRKKAGFSADWDAILYPTHVPEPELVTEA